MSTSPLRPENTPFGPTTKFCMWAMFADVINCAKFHLHWLSRFWAPGVRKSPFPIDLRYRSYNSVRTNVLHYDKVLIWDMIWYMIQAFLLCTVDHCAWTLYWTWPLTLKQYHEYHCYCCELWGLTEHIDWQKLLHLVTLLTLHFTLLSVLRSFTKFSFWGHGTFPVEYYMVLRLWPLTFYLCKFSVCGCNNTSNHLSVMVHYVCGLHEAWRTWFDIYLSHWCYMGLEADRQMLVSGPLGYPVHSLPPPHV